MRADIHDGQEHKRSVQGPDTEAQDLSPPNHHFPLATRGRSIQKCQEPTYAVQKIALAIRSLVGDGPIFVAAALLASVRNSRNGIYGTYLQFSLLRRSPP
jgi:hypothetical protein